MPLHDWTRVNDGAFHDFHMSWILEIKRAVKRLLPAGYYVMAEQIGGALAGPETCRAIITQGFYARAKRCVVVRREGDDRMVARIEVRCLDAGISHTFSEDSKSIVSHFRVGASLPEMPLFLTSENYVRVPLEEAYMTAWQDVPERYQQALK